VYFPTESIPPSYQNEGRSNRKLARLLDSHWYRISKYLWEPENCHGSWYAMYHISFSRNMGDWEESCEAMEEMLFILTKLSLLIIITWQNWCPKLKLTNEVLCSDRLEKNITRINFPSIRNKLSQISLQHFPPSRMETAKHHRKNNILHKRNMNWSLTRDLIRKSYFWNSYLNFRWKLRKISVKTGKINK